jgi:DAACS family dicarboxylate/amino acid:cation (Na+ or H+) symporter
MALHNRILIGLVLGALIGVSVNWTLATSTDLSALRQLPAGVEAVIRNGTEPIGNLWLNALIMVVIPLVVSTLALGVAGLGSLAKVGRIGGIALLSFLSLTAMAATLGLVMVNTIRPGTGLDPAIQQGLMETYKSQSEQAMGLAQTGVSIDLLVGIVPRNPVKAMADFNMLAIIFFSLMVGVALTRLAPDKARPLLALLESIAQVTIAIIDMVMRVAPYAVFCLIFSVTARFGFDLLVSLASYVLTVIAGLVLFMVVVYPLALIFVARRRPREFFQKAWIVIVTAFSTSSSNATLPTTLRVAEEELNVPNEVAGFVVPLGATMNMNGTALFEGVTVLFVAQVFGISLPLDQQIVVILMSVVVAVGAAGVPGGSIPLLMMVLGMVGAPMQGIAIVLGVDRILDMCRTTVNVTGDLVTATIVNRFAGVKGTTVVELPRASS